MVPSKQFHHQLDNVLASRFAITSRLHLLTVPQPEAVPHPLMVLGLVVMVGAPKSPVGVIVSMLKVTRVLVPGSVAVIVSVRVIVAPDPGPDPGPTGVVILNSPEVMIPVVLPPE